MKKKNFTESKILSIIKQYEGGGAIDDLYRENGISKATVYLPYKIVKILFAIMGIVGRGIVRFAINGSVIYFYDEYTLIPFL